MQGDQKGDGLPFATAPKDILAMRETSLKRM
jgi:hypothetical protein